MGVNVNDGSHPFTAEILSGVKTVETRGTDSLRPYVGRRVGIVRTGKSCPALLVGFATIGEPVCYETPAEFRADYGRHRVPVGSAFDCGAAGRFGYPLSDVRACRPRRVGGRGGRVARRIDRLAAVGS